MRFKYHLVIYIIQISTIGKIKIINKRNLRRSNNSLVRGKHHCGHFNRTRFQTKRCIRIARLHLQLQQHPNIIAQLQRLIQHVLSLNISLCNCENIIGRHFGGQTVGRSTNPIQIVLHFIGGRNLFPCRQENTFVQLAILQENGTRMNQTCKVENVHVVFDGHLKTKMDKKNKII